MKERDSIGIWPLKMKNLLYVCFLTLLLKVVSASVFLPHEGPIRSSASSTFASASKSLTRERDAARRQLRLHLHSSRKHSNEITGVAMAIPGYGVAEQVFVGGFANFLSVYNLIITARILLSWFPQAQGVGLLQPVYAITDPFLNLFRGLIPPLFGLDFSPILAFFLLNVLGQATAAVGAELPPNYQHNSKKTKRLLQTSFAALPN
jgi:YggT family protein